MTEPERPDAEPKRAASDDSAAGKRDASGGGDEGTREAKRGARDDGAEASRDASAGGAKAKRDASGGEDKATSDAKRDASGGEDKATSDAKRDASDGGAKRGARDDGAEASRDASGGGAGRAADAERRVRMLAAGRRREVQAAVIALLASIAIGSVLMLIAGKAPGHVWWAMVTRTAGEPYLLGQVLYKATALTLTGLSVALALDAGLFNIGAEGQLTAGVLACALVGAALPAGTPAVIAIPVCVLAAAIAGAAIGGAIGVLRVTRGAHEVITSIMLNAIVAGVALYLGNRVIFRGGTTRGAAIAPGAELPQLGLGGSSANAAVVLAALAAVGLWWLRSQTTWGRAWRAVGQSPEAARSTGISVGKVQILVMAGSGALAGLAAANFVLGHKHAFEEGLGRGTGLLGISAALLGRTHPIGVAGAALVLGFLSSGGLAVGDLIPKELTEMLQGVVVLAVAAAGPWVRRAEAAQ